MGPSPAEPPFTVRQYRRARAEVAPYARTISVVAVVAIVWAVWASGPGWLTPVYVVFAVAGTALAVIDVRTHRLPNALVFPLDWATGALLTLAALGTGEWWALGRAALGGLAAFALYQVFYRVTRRSRGIGYGDVKLSLSLGTILAWHSWSLLLTGIFATHLLATVVVIVLVLVRRSGWKAAIAFGPYMLLGTALALTWVRLTGW